MSPCYFPVGRYQYDRFGGHITSEVPCGQCIGCTLDYASGWASRIHHEASLNKDNSFVTLTYNTPNLPGDYSVHRSEIQEFIRNLRRKTNTDVRIRYYGCGEYGDADFYGPGRPHYHIILFGYSPPDQKVFKYGNAKIRNNQMYLKRSDNTIYRSKIIEDIWKKGFITVGEVSYDSASYVARYTTKKVRDKRKSDEWYKGRKPEFALMSRQPGIGHDWIQRYMTDVYPKDFFTINGVKKRPPRYYDQVYQKYCAKNGMYDEWEKLKEKRKEKIERYSDRRKLQKCDWRKKITKPLIRKLEKGIV